MIGAAWAEPLVHDGDPAEAMATVTARAGVDASTLAPTTFASLRARPPVLVAGGAVAACTPGPTDPEASLQKAEGALLYGRFDEASARIDEARNGALCAATWALPTQARIELVAGLVAEERGDRAAAELRYRAALGYDRSVAWPTAYPSERKALFDAVAAGAVPGVTGLGIRPSVPAATIDGAPAAAEVRAGEHVVRVGDVAVRVTLDEAPNRLVVPAAFPPDALRWMGDDARRADLTALLAATLGEGADVWVVDGDTAWHGIAGRADWEAFRPSSPAPPPPPPVPLEVARRGPSPLVGLVTGAVGVGLGFGGTALANHAAAVADVRDRDQWGRQRAMYGLGLVTLGVGWGLSGVGVGLGAVGLASPARRDSASDTEIARSP